MTALTLVWGSSYFFTVLALESFSPLVLVFLRVGLGALVLGLMVIGLRLRLPRFGRIYVHSLLLGIVSIALPFVLITESQRHVNSSMTTILVSTTPMFVFLLATVCIKAERSTLMRLVGIVLSLIGVAALYGVDGALTVEGWYWPLLIIAGAFLYASSNVYTKRSFGQLHPIVVAFLQVTSALVVLTPIALCYGVWPEEPPNTLALLGVIELGILGSGLAYVMFTLLLRAWGSTAASINTYLQPIVGVILGAVVLREAMTESGWLALSIILAGIAIFGFGSVLGPRLHRRPSGVFDNPNLGR